MAHFVPSRNDFESARTILASFRLPNELALCILDEARYWLETKIESTEHVILVDGAWSRESSATYPYIYAPAFPTTNECLKIREIEFTIVSHDQGWTTEDSQGTYRTSSWFEASIIRPKQGKPPLTQRRHLLPGLRRLRDMNVRGEIVDSVCAALDVMYPFPLAELVRRPSSVVEPQRTHCTELMEVKSQGVKEGEYAWYLQGNEVARQKAVFEGEMVKRYHITWGCKTNPVQSTNEGAGIGEGFIDTLEQDDFICLWARVKVSCTGAILQGSVIVCNTWLTSTAEARLGEPCSWCSNGHPIYGLVPNQTQLSLYHFPCNSSLHKQLRDENSAFQPREGRSLGSVNR